MPPHDDALTPPVAMALARLSARPKPVEPQGVRVQQPAPRARWERSLGEVTTTLRARLRRTLPGLAHEHDDLLHDTLASLTTHAQRALREGTAPAMWCEPTSCGPLEGGPREELLRVAHTILRRRVADLFRARARAWQAGLVTPSGGAQGEGGSGENGGDELSNAAGESELRTPEAERHSLLVRMLRVCARVLDELTDEDRELLESAADERERAQPLTDRERQRLRRARQRLTVAIRDALGDDAAALLRDEG